MSYITELRSWMSPSHVDTDPRPAPEIGRPAPSSDRLRIPSSDGKHVVITFLRHCGCPFAEKTYLLFRSTASANPNVRFIVISHSDQASTDHWLEAVGGSTPSNLEVIVDAERTLYATWGLGVSSFWHVLSPGGLSAVFKLGREEGIWNRPTESGSRWQTSGSWAVDEEGIVRWGRVAERADEIPDFVEAIKMMEANE
ncbi:hypothetical protein NA57DRAFT_33892 [Rhizodiscina lignyota]|uniref:Thioredoxin domain-containing protein n=1 Tax=Rhizodiscina lignyota TaxID=1504668 RepID=A0A9P4IN83_9PEZI|nr:hypothetical protein NA57DRAFT_33892 [Rhizodiscina lignyota]